MTVSVKLQVLAAALRKVEWVYYRSDTYEGVKCYACGAQKMPGRGHKRNCTTHAALKLVRP